MKKQPQLVGPVNAQCSMLDAPLSDHRPPSTDLPLDVPLYRIFSKPELTRALWDRELELRKPASWGDPFGDYLLARVVNFQGCLFTIADLQDQFYGQCWSLCIESDAMWRIYAPANFGIKVKTTARKLLSLLACLADQNPPLRWFLAKVQYLDQQQILQLFSNAATFPLFDPTSPDPAATLIVKPLEFSHEQEVRLLFHEEIFNSGPRVRFLPLDANAAFEEMEIDPRIHDPALIESWTDEFRDLGFENPIRQSALYRLSALSGIRVDPTRSE